MNYAKHFSGSAEAGTTAAHYYLNTDGTVGASFSSNSSIVKETVIGEAIESTLKDCGLTHCKYYGLVDNKPISYLCLDDTAEGKPGFYIYYQATYTYYLLGYRADNSSSVITHIALPSSGSDVAGMRVTNSQANIFSTASLVANTYDTYVRVTGDTASSFVITFANYNTLTFNTPISISMMTDKRNDSDVIGYFFGNSSFQNVAPMYKETNLSATGAANYTSVSASPSNAFALVDNYMILVNKFCQIYIYLWFNDGYIPPQNVTAGTFIEIDGDIYYVQTYGMFKCTTTIS